MTTEQQLPPILDACCGGRQFWFDKENPNVLFADCRVMPELPRPQDWRRPDFQMERVRRAAFGSPEMHEPKAALWTSERQGAENALVRVLEAKQPMTRSIQSNCRFCGVIVFLHAEQGCPSEQADRLVKQACCGRCSHINLNYRYAEATVNRLTRLIKFSGQTELQPELDRAIEQTKNWRKAFCERTGGRDIRNPYKDPVKEFVFGN